MNTANKVISHLIEKLNCGKGNELSTKELLDYSTGILKGANTKYEKRRYSQSKLYKII